MRKGWFGGTVLLTILSLAGALVMPMNAKHLADGKDGRCS